MNLGSPLVGLKFLLTRPCERVRLQAERETGVRPLRRACAFRAFAVAPKLDLAVTQFFVFLWKFRTFTKPLSGVVEPSGRGGRI